MKRLLFLLAVLIIILSVGQAYNLFPSVSRYLNISQPNNSSTPSGQKQTVVYEESVITKVVRDSLSSVVTVGIMKTTTQGGSVQIDPFNPFAPLQQIPGQQVKIDQNIGSGFVASADGLIITNKHVVADTEATYKIVTNGNKTYNVEKIYRDPLNDIAILKTNANGLKPLSLGDSTNLQLGQMAIAIGTPLGEFRNTVTHGIISGLGRGITAGSPYEGYVEKLDNVIQTDAPISPGNSGGPLLNSGGQVIGINTAIASEGQNIGFAIPVNVVKEILTNFEKRGSSFERPYIGVRYKMIDQPTAVRNEIVEGAYVLEVIDGSPAAKAGIQVGDIITEFDGQKIKGTDDQSLAKIILNKKIGDTINLKLWRNGETKNISLTLEAAK
jgi:serine protease Do